MSRQLVESKLAESRDDVNYKVHKLATWYDSESEDVIIPQCGERANRGYNRIDGIIESIHEKCEKCFSDAYE